MNLSTGDKGWLPPNKTCAISPKGPILGEATQDWNTQILPVFICHLVTSPDGRDSPAWYIWCCDVVWYLANMDGHSWHTNILSALQRTPRYKPPQKERVSFFSELWNIGISSRLPSLQLLLSKMFKKRLEKVWTEVFPHWLKFHLPNCLTPSLPPNACHPLKAPISIFYPNPCFVYVVSSSLLWPPFYHYKSYS